MEHIRRPQGRALGCAAAARNAKRCDDRVGRRVRSRPDAAFSKAGAGRPTGHAPVPSVAGHDPESCCLTSGLGSGTVPFGRWLSGVPSSFTSRDSSHNPKRYGFSSYRSGRTFLASPEWSSAFRGPRASKHACFLGPHLWHGIASDGLERDSNGAVKGASCI